MCEEKNKISYSDFLRRLVVYRKKQGLSQEELGSWMGVEQSHYFKLENGYKIISLKSLQNFEKAGGDVLWLLTGKMYESGCFDIYFKKCRSDRERRYLLEGILWTIKCGSELSPAALKIYTRIHKMLLVMENNIEDNSLWRAIRETENITQERMAALLDINIKRYRRIEKGIVAADTEILILLYAKLGYSPHVFLDKMKFCVYELNTLWNLINDNDKKKLQKYVDYAYTLVNGERSAANV